MEIIRLSIDVTKIDKDRLYEGKNGAKYLNCAMIPTPDSKYGSTHMIIEDVSKEERAAGTKGNIIGNAKAPVIASSPAPTQAVSNNSEDVPF